MSKLKSLMGAWATAQAAVATIEKLEQEIAEEVLKTQGKDALVVMPDGRRAVLRKLHNLKDGTVREGHTLSFEKPKQAKERKVVAFESLTSEAEGEQTEVQAEGEPTAEVPAPRRRGRKQAEQEAAPEAPPAAE